MEYMFMIIEVAVCYLLYRRMKRVQINGRIRTRRYNPRMKRKSK